VSYQVGRLDHVLRRRLRAALEPHGLALSEYTTLSVLRDRSGLSNAQLARRSLITPQAMNEVLARLESRRLVRRRADQARGRVRPAELTKAGERVLRAADASVDAVEREMLAGLSAPDRTFLAGLLASALRGLSRID
jgi:DNA-binding MarR family transcriptional regulator